MPAAISEQLALLLLPDAVAGLGTASSGEDGGFQLRVSKARRMLKMQNDKDVTNSARKSNHVC